MQFCAQSNSAAFKTPTNKLKLQIFILKPNSNIFQPSLYKKLVQIYRQISKVSENLKTRICDTQVLRLLGRKCTSCEQTKWKKNLFYYRRKSVGFEHFYERRTLKHCINDASIFYKAVLDDFCLFAQQKDWKICKTKNTKCKIIKREKSQQKNIKLFYNGEITAKDIWLFYTKIRMVMNYLFRVAKNVNVKCFMGKY